MFLFKCKCGSVFTVTSEKRAICCPNCEEIIPLTGMKPIPEFCKSLEKNGFSLRLIPDDAKIRIEFDA